MFATVLRLSRAHVVALMVALVAALSGGLFFTGSTSADASPLQAEGPDRSGQAVEIESAVDPLGHLAGVATVRAASATQALRVAATPPPPPPFACPAPGSEFIDSYGFARSGGRRHKGVDMMAPHGTPVLAPVAGAVRHSNSVLGGLGFYLVDADGNEYFGSHLASLTETGFVEAGDLLGTVGSTGNASPGGPHLHFEVSLAGRGNVNPYPFARFWCGDEAATVDPTT